MDLQVFAFVFAVAPYYSLAFIFMIYIIGLVVAIWRENAINRLLRIALFILLLLNIFFTIAFLRYSDLAQSINW